MNQITIKNKHIELTILNYGAIIQKLLVKNKNGKLINVVVGNDNPIEYLNDDICLGACVGRFAGRISSKGFELDDKNYPLYIENDCHLHGGKEGFAKKYWNIDEVGHDKQPYVKLSYRSPHMEEGYPGNLTAMVTYTLVDNALCITHTAQTDETTVVNLTNHSYFKLDDEDSIDHYNLQLQCPEILETRENLVPTGKIISVKNTDYDFLMEKKIGKIRLDTPFVVSSDTQKAARVYSEKSGIFMEVTTNQPAVVVLTSPVVPALCFETQNYPDAPNNPSFPSSILLPGESYHNQAIFKFGFVN